VRGFTTLLQNVEARSAGSVFHLLQAILGLRADAPRRRLYLDPELPSWLPDLALRGLQVGPARLDLRFWREGATTRWDASLQEGDVEVQQEAWAPWPMEQRPGVERSPSSSSEPAEAPAQ
jgi:hypothetical protein